MKNSQLIKSFLFIALIIAAVVCSACGESTSEKIKRYTRTQVQQCQLDGRTPGGVRFRAARMPSTAMLAALDEGWRRLDLIAAHYNFANLTNRENYQIYLIPEEQLSYGGVPSLTVPINCKRDLYCGSEFDKGLFKVNKKGLFDQSGKSEDPDIHYITAAERVFPETLGSLNQIYTVVVPREDTPENFMHTVRATIYGGEHFFLGNNDWPRYGETIGAGNDLHPLLPVPEINQ